VDRVATDRFGRHPEWYGWLKIYLPTLLLGTLPWTGELLRWARALPARVRAWRERQARAEQAGALLLALWIALPLLVFCLAQSRLP
ncbi:glycosyltransferase, partial [Salinisphaera sp. USBA-960]|nr:glycosyltransferase [Salifodinibacter halophilus]